MNKIMTDCLKKIESLMANIVIKFLIYKQAIVIGSSDMTDSISFYL